MKRNTKISSSESQCPEKNPQEDVRNSSFDERRVQVLKARVIQLERQNQLLLDSISQRAVSFEDVDQVLTSVANFCRRNIAKEGCTGPEVNVLRGDLISCVQQLEGAKRRMYHIDDRMTKAGSVRPIILQDCLMSNENSKKPMTSTNLLDASTGKLEHLNLKFVAKLESQLSSLRRELLQLQHSFDEHKTLNSAPISTSEDFLLNKIKQRQIEQIEKCSQLLQTSSENLMDLNMLHPSAPWGPLRRPLFQSGVTVEQVMAALPRSSSNSSKVKAIIEALMKAVNYKHLLCQQQIQALKEDLKFHNEVYSLQLTYTHSLMTSLKDGYKKFHESMAKTLFLPLEEVLDAFFRMKNKGDEESWTNFLATFKVNADTLKRSTELMSENHLHSKEVLLDGYLSDFHLALAQMELNKEKGKSENSQLRSEQLVKQQHLEDALNECLTVKDRKSSEDVSHATTVETSLSRENTSNWCQSPKIQSKIANEASSSSQHHLLATGDAEISIKPNVKDLLPLRRSHLNKVSWDDKIQEKLTLKSDKKITRKKLT